MSTSSAVDAADLRSACDGIDPLPRGLPPVDDLASFFRVRVMGHYDGYYRPRVTMIDKRLKWFRGIGIALGAVGVVLGTTAAVLDASLASWIAVVATIGTAVAAHVAATRYQVPAHRVRAHGRGAPPDKVRADRPDARGRAAAARPPRRAGDLHREPGVDGEAGRGPRGPEGAGSPLIPGARLL